VSGKIKDNGGSTKVAISVFSFLAGILGGLASLFGLVGLQSGRGLAQFLFSILALSAYISISVGGFGCLSLQNSARRLLLMGSLVILFVHGIFVMETISTNSNTWDVVSNIILFCYFVLPICNLYIFTRPKVKEQFK
jgi:hypothetical protein